MFNSHAAGGYLIWELYPWKQVFTDTRSTDIASIVEYGFISKAESGPAGERPGWARLLDMYGINFMVVAPQDYYGGMDNLVKNLLENDRWALVHYDPEYMIFVKNTDQNREVIEKHGIRSQDAYWMLIYKTSYMLMVNPKSPYLYATVGYCFEKLGKYDEAEKAYTHALKSLPQDKGLKEALVRVSASAGAARASTN